MTSRFRLLLLLTAGAGLLALSCNSSFFLNGALDGDCIAPRTLDVGDGGADPATVRMANCQVANAVCCRVSAKASRTSCQYPEDCYVAPYQGPCATPVDCSDTQTCTGGTCQCTAGGPPCPDPVSQVVACCALGEVCSAGACGPPLDGGLETLDAGL
jgi:hypothetical protein